MRTRRDFLTPGILIGLVVIVIFALWIVICDAQTHNMPGSNVVPSGASLTINSGASITAAAGSTVTGFTSGLVIGTNVQAWDTDLDVWATKTPYAGSVVVTTGKTFTDTNNLTLSGTDGSTLNVGGGGTLGTAAYTASTAYLAIGGGTLTGNLTVNVASASLILNPVSVGSIIEMRGTQNTQDGLKLSATATLGLLNADSLVIKNRANSVTYGTFSSTALDLTNGITIGAAAASGKILQGNGTRFGASTPTWPTASGAAGYTVRSDATNFASYPAQLVNSSVSAQSPSTSDVYLAGSAIVVTAGDFKAGGQYKCVFDMTKSAGTGSIVITLRVGTGTGAVGDAAIQTYTFGAGTSVADFGMFEVVATFRTVGSGTSAVIQGMCRATHQLTTTGLISNAAGWMVLGSPSPSSGFNSSTGTVIGLSFNGSTAFAGTTQVVQAQLQQ